MDGRKEKVEFEFEVNGQMVATGDHLLDGRQVRSRAGFNPAAEFALIEIRDGYLASVGLEEEVRLERGERRVFRVMEGGDAFAFTVNDVGWEWGAATIGDKEVRLYGRIPEDHDLFLGAESNEVVEPGSAIELTTRGTERIYSRARGKPKRIQVTFVINGDDVAVKARTDEPLRDALDRALKESENTGQPTEGWDVRNEAGEILDASLTLAALGIVDGAVLVASLKTGAAG